MLMLASEMWWTGQQAGLFGGIAGSMCGLLGASIGVISASLVSKGKGRNIVYGMFSGMFILGFITLSIGLVALLKDQPYHVWYPGLLIGFIFSVITCSIFPVIVARYRQAEHRAMDADLLRGGQPRNKEQASVAGVISFALITILITSGMTYGAIVAFLPQVTFPNSHDNTTSDISTTKNDSNNFVLDNGVRVRLLPFPDIEWVGIIASYDVGFIDDPKGFPQMAHLAEHLRVTGATHNATANESWNYLNEIGSANAETQPHFTYYDYLVPKDQLALILQTEADRLSTLQLTQEDILREGPRAAAEATNIASNNPAYLHKFALMAAIQAWRYGETHADIVTGLDTTPIEAVQSFLTTHYRPDTLTLYVAGDFDVAIAHGLLHETLGNVPIPTEPKSVRNEDWTGVANKLTMTWDLPATIVAAAFEPPKSPHDRAIVSASFVARMSRLQIETDSFLLSPLGTSMQWPSGVLPTFSIGTVNNVTPPQNAVSRLTEVINSAPPSSEVAMARQYLQMRIPELTDEMVKAQAKQLTSRGFKGSKAQGMIVLQSALNKVILEYSEKADVSMSNDIWNRVLAEALSPSIAGTLVIQHKSE